MTATVVAASILVAPPAVADSADSLRFAVASVHSASCGPLQSDPLVEEAAQLTNLEEDTWLNQEGRAVPTDDPLPLLKDRGFGGEKAKLLKGAGVTDGLSMKGLLISGYLDLPDCTYKLYGVSVIRNRTTNYILTSVVLAS